MVKAKVTMQSFFGLTEVLNALFGKVVPTVVEVRERERLGPKLPKGLAKLQFGSRLSYPLELSFIFFNYIYLAMTLRASPNY